MPALRLAIVIGIAVPITTISGQASAMQQGSDTESSSPTDKTAERMICKSIHSTGSRLSTNRVCKTRSEWQRLSEETADALDQVRDRPTGTPNPR